MKRRKWEKEYEERGIKRIRREEEEVEVLNPYRIKHSFFGMFTMFTVQHFLSTRRGMYVCVYMITWTLTWYIPMAADTKSANNNINIPVWKKSIDRDTYIHRYIYR